MIDSGLVGRGAARAENAHGTPTQSHTSPSILVYEEETEGGVVKVVDNERAGLPTWSR